MEFLPEAINTYIEAHSEDEPKLLAELNRETHLKVLQSRMLSGHYQGRVLSLISKLIQPKTILEIGTYTGYSALCLAEGLQKEGMLHTIDNNEELVALQRTYFNKSVYKSQIIPHLGNALSVIEKLDMTFDLVFIDADKPNYPNYFKQILPKLNKNAVILSDNVLWSGKVVKPLKANDASTKAILEYNTLLKNESSLETVIFPIRDGLTLSRKK